MQLATFITGPTTFANLPDTIEVPAACAAAMHQAYRDAVRVNREFGALFVWKGGEGLSLKCWTKGDEGSVLPDVGQLNPWEGRVVGTFHTHFTASRSGHSFSGPDLAGMDMSAGWTDAVQSDNGLCYLMVQPLGAIEIPSTFRTSYPDELQHAVRNLASDAELREFNDTQIVGLAIYSKALQFAELFHRASGE